MSESTGRAKVTTTDRYRSVGRWGHASLDERRIAFTTETLEQRGGHLWGIATASMGYTAGVAPTYVHVSPLSDDPKVRAIQSLKALAARRLGTRVLQSTSRRLNFTNSEGETVDVTQLSVLTFNTTALERADLLDAMFDELWQSVSARAEVTVQIQ